MTNQELLKIKKFLSDSMDIAVKSTDVFNSKDPGKEIDIEFDVIQALKHSIVVVAKSIERNKEIYD